MPTSNPVYQLLDWLKNFKAEWLQNEDEVETKFVIPLFQKLGYSDEFYRGKYPTKTYSPGKSGRKPESDRVYFSVSSPEQQNKKTSLIVIEAKEPKDTQLEKAIEQAEFYETSLKPVFLVATNGYHLKVIKPNRCAESEVVFDLTIEELLSKIETTQKFYEQLNFKAVGRAKKQYQDIADALPHEKYILLEKALRNYPELQTILEQGEFEPELQTYTNRLKIIKPKVSVECSLPVLLKEGNCEIKFSNILRRGLQITVNHRDILGKFMIGLGTSVDWGTRSFIKKVSEDAFEVVLGDTFTTLSRLEIEDLCSCIDEICQRYKDTILEVETLLEAEKYIPVKIPNFSIPGFRLLSVQQWFWDLMKNFSEEQCNKDDRSEWDIFAFNTRAIRIKHGLHTNAYLYPVHCDGDYSNNLLGGYVDVIYAVDDTSFTFSARLDKTTWQQTIGLKGIWTVEYTKKWLIEKLIPKIESYYSDEFEKYYWQFSENSEEGWYRSYVSYETDANRKIPLEKADKPKHLVPYLHDVQSWIHIYHIYRYNLDASILRSYYKNFIELCREADFSTGDRINYLIENMYAIDLRQSGKECDYNFMRSLNKDYILQALNQHLERINRVEYEFAFIADLISRSFIAIVKNYEIRYSQSQLNAARHALIPLWKQSQFEERYVFPKWITDRDADCR